MISALRKFFFDENDFLETLKHIDVIRWIAAQSGGKDITHQVEDISSGLGLIKKASQ